jgi:hypothetical protein
MRPGRWQIPSDSTFSPDCHIDLDRAHVNLGLLMRRALERHLLAQETNARKRGAQMAVVSESLAAKDLDVLAMRPHQ